MLKKYHLFFLIIGILLAAFMVWYFSNIVIYVLVSVVLSFIGHPLLKYLDKIKIGKFIIPHSLNAFLTLLVIIFVFICFIWFFVPLITNQANMISNINTNEVGEYFKDNITVIQDFLIKHNIINADETIISAIQAQIESVISIATFSNAFKNLLSATGSFFMGIFSILFITFFFLRDEHMFSNFIILIVPEKYEKEVVHVFAQCKSLLSRYFIGLILELVSMMILITIGLSILGVKNALIIGFLGGLMNIIPYLGPIIGTSMGVVMGVTTTLSLGMYDQLGFFALGIIAIFLIANLIDNVLLQPLIYSSSIKARPIEIFLVIIMGGTIAGIPGMILAIPSYTIFRVIAKEFLSRFRLVKKLTEKM